MYVICSYDNNYSYHLLGLVPSILLFSFSSMIRYVLQVSITTSTSLFLLHSSSSLSFGSKSGHRARTMFHSYPLVHLRLQEYSSVECTHYQYYPSPIQHRQYETAIAITITIAAILVLIIDIVVVAVSLPEGECDEAHLKG